MKLSLLKEIAATNLSNPHVRTGEWKDWRPGKRNPKEVSVFALVASRNKALLESSKAHPAFSVLRGFEHKCG